MLPKVSTIPNNNHSNGDASSDSSSGNGSSFRFIPQPPRQRNPANNGQGVAPKSPPSMLPRLSVDDQQHEPPRLSDRNGAYRNSSSSDERGRGSDGGAATRSSANLFETKTPVIEKTSGESAQDAWNKATGRLADIKREIWAICLDDHPNPGSYSALAIKAAREISYIAELERVGSSSSTPEPNRVWIQKNLTSTLRDVLPHLNDSQLAHLEKAMESIGRKDLQDAIETQRDQNWNGAMLAARNCATEAIAALRKSGRPGGSIAEVARAFYDAASSADKSVQYYDDASDRAEGRTKLLQAFSAQLAEEVQAFNPTEKSELANTLNDPAMVELAAAARALSASEAMKEHPGLSTHLLALARDLYNLRRTLNPGPRQGPPPPPVRLNALSDGVSQALRVYGIDVSGRPRVMFGFAATGAQDAIRQSIRTALQTPAVASPDEAQFDNWNSSIVYNGRDSRERIESPVEFEYTDGLRELFSELEPAQRVGLSRLTGPQVLRVMQAVMSSPASPLRLPDGTPGELVGRYKMTMDLRSDGKGGFSLHADLDISEVNSFVAVGQPPRQFIPMGEGSASMTVEIPVSWDGVVDIESIATRFNFALTPSVPRAAQPLAAQLAEVAPLSPSVRVERSESPQPLTRGEKQIQRALTFLSIPFAEQSDLNSGDSTFRTAIKTMGHKGRNAAEAFAKDALPLLEKMPAGRLAALLDNLARWTKENPSSKEEFRTLRKAAEEVLYRKVSPGTRPADLLRTQAILEATQGDALHASTLFNWFDRKLITENDLLTRFRQLSTALLQVVVDSDIDTGAIDRVANAVLSERAASSPKGFVVPADDEIPPPPAEDAEDALAELHRVLAYERKAADETPRRPAAAQPGMSGPVAYVDSAPRRPPPLEIKSGDDIPVPSISPQRSPSAKWLDKKGKPLSREATHRRTLALWSVKPLTGEMLPPEIVQKNVEDLRKEKLSTLMPLLAEKSVRELTTFAENIKQGATPKQLKKKEVKALLAAIQAEIDARPQRASIAVSPRRGDGSETPSLVSASKNPPSASITEAAALARRLSFTDSVGIAPPVTPSRGSQSPRSSSSLSSPAPTIVSVSAARKSSDSGPAKRSSGVGKFFTRLAGVLSPRKSTGISEEQRQANIQQVGLALKEFGRAAADLGERTGHEVDGLAMLGRIENSELFTKNTRDEYIAANLAALNEDELAAIQTLVLRSTLGPRATSPNPLFERNEWLVALEPAVARALAVRLSARGDDAIKLKPTLAGVLVKASAIPAGQAVYNLMVVIAGGVLQQYGLEDKDKVDLPARRQLAIGALAHQLANGQVSPDELKAIFMTLSSDEMLAVVQSPDTGLVPAQAHARVVALCGQAIEETHRATAAAFEEEARGLGQFDDNAIRDDVTSFATWVISAARAQQLHNLHLQTHGLDEVVSVSTALSSLKRQFGGKISTAAVANVQLPPAEFREFVIGLQSLGLVDRGFVNTAIEARKTAEASFYVDSVQQALLSVQGFDLSQARNSLELAWRSAPAIADAWNDLADEGHRVPSEQLLEGLYPDLIRRAVDRLSPDVLTALSESLRAPLLLKMAEELRPRAGRQLLPRAASYLGHASRFINRLGLLQAAAVARMREENIAEPDVAMHIADAGPLLASEFGIEIRPDGNVNVVEGIAEEAAQGMFKQELFQSAAAGAPVRFELQGRGGNAAPVHFDVPLGLLASLREPSVEYEVRNGDEVSSIGKLLTMRVAPEQTAATSLFEMTGRDLRRWAHLSQAVDAQNARGAIDALMASRHSPVVLQDGTPGTVVGDTNIKITVTNDDNGDQLVRYDYAISNLSHFTPFDGGPSTVLESTGKVEFSWTHRVTTQDADLSTGLWHKRDTKQIPGFMDAFNRVELGRTNVSDEGVMKNVPAFVDAVVAGVAAYPAHKKHHDERGMPLDLNVYERFKAELRPLVEQGVLNKGPLRLMALPEPKRDALESTLRDLGFDNAANTLRLQARIGATARAAWMFLRDDDAGAIALIKEKVCNLQQDERWSVIRAALDSISESAEFLEKTKDRKREELADKLEKAMRV